MIRVIIGRKTKSPSQVLRSRTKTSCNLLGCDTEIAVIFLVLLLFNLQQI